MGKIIESKFIKKVFESESADYSEWFGYYNYDTLNEDHSRLLCSRASFDGVAPQKGMSIDLGYYDLNTREYHIIGSSDSWNWQQGAMLQWLPGQGNENKVIYNLSKNNRLISRIVDLYTGLSKDISWPIYGLTPDGKKSIALEMERSRWCRAYHYKSVENAQMEGRVYDMDGIFEIELEKDTRKRIVTIQDVIHTDYRPEFEHAKHWLEHIMISPSGRRFCFLHRFSPIDNVFSYKTRLFIADIDGSNLKSVEGWERMSWSHFGWKTDDEFVIYTVTEGRYKKIGGFKDVLKSKSPLSDLMKKTLVALSTRVPYILGRHLSGYRSCYKHYSVGDGNEANFVGNYESEPFGIDGHPSFTRDGKYMITDSYPDRKQMQRLTMYNTESKKAKIVGRFYATYNGNPASCDLHPKLSRDNQFVVVDSAFDTKHHMIVYRIDWDEIKKQLG